MTIDEILALPAYYRSSGSGSIRTGWACLGSYIHSYNLYNTDFGIHIPNEEDAEILQGYLMVLGIPSKVSTKLSVGMITSQAEGVIDDY